EVVMLEPLGDDVFFATVTHQGSSNIALWSVDENGQDLDLLVNDIGNYQGQVALNFGEDPAALRVEADGDWSIDLVSLGEAPCWDGGTTYEASGDSIVIVDGVADGLTPVTLTHQGESNFAIWAWGESHPDLIVNDIGIYDGTTLLPDGSLVLQVGAVGTWTIDLGCRWGRPSGSDAAARRCRRRAAASTSGTGVTLWSQMLRSPWHPVDCPEKCPFCTAS